MSEGKIQELENRIDVLEQEIKMMKSNANGQKSWNLQDK